MKIIISIVIYFFALIALIIIIFILAGFMLKIRGSDNPAAHSALDYEEKLTKTEAKK